MSKDTRYKVNPSLSEYGKKVYEIKKTIRTKQSREGVVDGKAKTIFVDERVKEWEDRREYIKLSEEAGGQLDCLSKQGVMVLSYILRSCLQFNSGIISLIGAKAADILKVNESTVNRGVQNLIDNGFLFRTEFKTEYWINISYFHKGSLMDEYKEYIKTVFSNHNFDSIPDNEEDEVEVI